MGNMPEHHCFVCAIGCLFNEIALLIDLLISHVSNKIKSATQPALGFAFCKINASFVSLI